MSDFEKNPDKNVNRENGSRQPKHRREPPRSSRAALVWLFILIGIGIMLLFKGYGPEHQKELSASDFEKHLAAKEIKTADLSREGEGIFRVNGTLKKSGSKQDIHYTTRILWSDALREELKAAGVRTEIKEDSSGIWNFILVSVLPLLLIIGVIYSTEHLLIRLFFTVIFLVYSESGSVFVTLKSPIVTALAEISSNILPSARHL